MKYFGIISVLIFTIVVTGAQIPRGFPRRPAAPPRPLRQRNMAVPVRRFVVENEVKVHEITHFKRPNTGIKRPNLSPDAMKKCQISGCPSGLECVLEGVWICPHWIPSLPCQCRPGCRHRNFLILPGETKTIDSCGSTCSCYSMLGTVNCNHKNC